MCSKYLLQISSRENMSIKTKGKSRLRLLKAQRHDSVAYSDVMLIATPWRHRCCLTPPPPPPLSVLPEDKLKFCLFTCISGTFLLTMGENSYRERVQWYFTIGITDYIYILSNKGNARLYIPILNETFCDWLLAYPLIQHVLQIFGISKGN